MGLIKEHLGIVASHCTIVKGDIIELLGFFFHGVGVFLALHLRNHTHAAVVVFENLVTLLADGVLSHNIIGVGICQINRCDFTVFQFAQLGDQIFGIVAGGFIQINGLVFQLLAVAVNLLLLFLSSLFHG